MIFYEPVSGQASISPFKYRPRTCFIMTKLGKSVSIEIQTIRNELSDILKKYDLKEVDAESDVTGKDFLMKIWKMIIQVPLGIAIIDSNMSPQTLSNIFYELGLMQAYGKEILVIKTKDAIIPSDLVRTEYIEYGSGFQTDLDKYFDTFFSIPGYYEEISELLEQNPLLSIDYLKRAYLIAGDEKYRTKAEFIYDNASIEGRAKNSVEALLIKF